MNTSPTRRQALLGLACITLPACTTHPAQPTMTNITTPIDALFSELADELLQERPPQATELGTDVGTHAALRSQLSDRSLTAAQTHGERCRDRLSRIRALNQPGLAADLRATLESALFVHEAGVEGASFGYGDQGVMASIDHEGTPYVVNQMIGSLRTVTTLLASIHPLVTSDDASSWMARLGAFAAAVDAETERLQHDRGRGVVAPKFIIQATLNHIRAFITTAPEKQMVVTALQRRLAADAGSGRLVAQAMQVLSDHVRPAAERQYAALVDCLQEASDEPGVRRLPEGDRYYAWALRVATTTSLTARDIHQLGLEQARGIEARMDTLLQQQGLKQGSVGQRMLALANDASQRFSNDDAGRQQAIDYCQATLQRLRAAMPNWSGLKLQAPAQVHRVPVALEGGAPSAYMTPGSLDGQRAAVFSLNLRNTADWPRLALPTLVAHETLPGHVWQEAYEIEQATRPLLRRLLKFNGYSEGWALYAEQLVDEAGFYDDDPIAQLGYLQSEQLRATRLVVDTGLHAFGWTRAQAVAHLSDMTGRPATAVSAEIDRYCVKPGQACGYKVGQLQMLKLRAQAQQWAGASFDVRPFNDAVLAAGNLPFAALETALSSTLGPRSRQ